MCVSVCVRERSCVYIVHVFIRLVVCVCGFTFVCSRTRVFVCLVVRVIAWLCSRTRVFVCIFVCVRLFSCLCVRVCLWVFASARVCILCMCSFV